MGARQDALAYECREGAALKPLPAGYRRREPEKSVLHEVVREHLESFLAELQEEGRSLPRFVEKELRSYLSCGLLGEGFVRCVCRSCGDEILVAFSCKGRGFCPSCCARRMSDTAAHLVDRVLPVVAYRQWVLSYPRRLRLAFARDVEAAAESATIFLREVFRSQRRQADLESRDGVSGLALERPRVAAPSAGEVPELPGALGDGEVDARARAPSSPPATAASACSASPLSASANRPAQARDGAAGAPPRLRWSRMDRAWAEWSLRIS